MVAHLLSLLLLPLGLRLVTATCFYPNGSTADDHVECGTSGICCAEGFKCLTNGLCHDIRYENWQRVLRGACTDKSWGSGCTSFCKTNWPDRDEFVSYCGGGRWCCSGDECCSAEMGIMELGDPVEGVPGPIATTSISKADATSTQTPAQASSTSGQNDGAQTSGSAAPASSSSPDKQGQQGSTVSPASSSPTEPSATPQPATVTVTSSPSATTTSSYATANASRIYKNKNSSIAIGAGVGVGVGVTLIVAILGSWLFIRRRKNKRQEGVMHRSVELESPLSPDPKPFERKDREHYVELEGDRVAEMPGTKLDAREMDGLERGQEHGAIPAVIEPETEREREREGKP